jgi:S-adenosylmethionine hydrolase
VGIITLTTDFGLQDPYAGIMKGVMLSIAPSAVLVDLAHDVPPQDITAGALALEAAVAYFPAGTIHLAVVDPGVGSGRQAVAIRCERFLLVGPDNGLFGLVLERHPSLEAVRLDNPAYRLQRPSATFHGRDIFAPAAAHLHAGAPLKELGPPAILEGEPPAHMVREHGASLVTSILYVDRFGNLITGLRAEELSRWGAASSEVAVRVGDSHFTGIASTYSDAGEGRPVAYMGSGGRLEIAIRNGNAADALRVGAGEEVVLTPHLAPAEAPHGSGG